LFRLNYHHLFYFWSVAREGSIARASEELRLSQPTLSSQIRLLEESLGERLFQRIGRGLMLTESGHLVFRYANDIFLTGQEMVETLAGRPSGQPLRLVVGVSHAVPKLVARWLLEPVMRMDPAVRIICREQSTDELLAELSRHAIDVVLADEKAGPMVKVKVFNHLLGESGLSVFGAASLAARYRRNFPGSLDGAPMLVPLEGTSVRRALEQFFGAAHLRPYVVAEVEDTGLLKELACQGRGVFVAPTLIEKEIIMQYRVKVVGRLPDLHQRFYAISVEKKVKHPAVIAICEMARAAMGAPARG